MKKIIVILLLLTAMSVNGQWVRVINANTGPYSRVVNYNGNILACYDKVYKTTDLGQTWTLFCDANYQGVNSLSVLNGNVWVGNFYNNVYTTNGGINWTAVNLSRFVYDFISYNSRIFAGTESYNCYYSDDGGLNWLNCPDAGVDVVCFKAANSRLLAGTSQGIYYTTNNGTNWTLAQMPGLPTHDIISNTSQLFAGANSIGVWTSTNDGINWAQTSLGNVSAEALESYGVNVFAGTFYNGFYVSSNNGANWTQRNEGIGSVTITSLAISGNTIFAATQSAGIWKRQISEIVGIQNISTELPSKFSLSQNYPNPFNSSSNLKFQIVKLENVKILVYDVQGREVQTLVNERLSAGTYEVTFDGSMLTSGVYFYKLLAEGYTETKRMLLLK